MQMDMALTIRITGRFVRFLCALASLTRLTFGCTQTFLDIIGPGVRVSRGPDWKYGDQDGNSLGTVTSEISSSDWITVRWDSGHTNSYRVGHQGKCDLALVDTQHSDCHLFRTNMDNTGDFLLSYRNFPRPVEAPYHCSRTIVSPDETKVVALHVLMIDTCNTTIDSGTYISSGCDMVSGTYVSSYRSLNIETFKELGTKYGFMVHVTYEEKECAYPTPILIASKGVPGYIKSPYSKFTLARKYDFCETNKNDHSLKTVRKCRILCLWEIVTDLDQILELTITYLDDERMIDLREDVHSAWIYLRSERTVHYYTSNTSRVIIRYEKFQTYKSKGFQIVYKTKDKPTKAFCPEMVKTLEPGDNGLLKLPEYDLKNTGPLECNWYLRTKSETSLIHLTATRLATVHCPIHSDDLKVNGVSFARIGSCEKDSFSVTAKEIAINYAASSSPNNSVIVLEYQTTKVPFCFGSEPISVDGNKAFLVVPDFEHNTSCKWTLVSPENQQVNVEVISQTESDWEPYKAFLVFDIEDKTWKKMTGNKVTSQRNKLIIKYLMAKRPDDFSGIVIVTYAAVLPMTPTAPTTPTTPMVPLTPTIPKTQSSTTSSQADVECTQPGIPIWCYIVIILLSVASVALLISSSILYRRQIYAYDEDGSLLNLRYKDIIVKDDHT